MTTIKHKMTHEVWMLSHNNGTFLEERIAQFCNEEEAQMYADMRPLTVSEYTTWEVREVGVARK